jgi:hypothetical protein
MDAKDTMAKEEKDEKDIIAKDKEVGNDIGTLTFETRGKKR